MLIIATVLLALSMVIAYPHLRDWQATTAESPPNQIKEHRASTANNRKYDEADARKRSPRAHSCPS